MSVSPLKLDTVPPCLTPLAAGAPTRLLTPPRAGSRSIPLGLSDPKPRLCAITVPFQPIRQTFFRQTFTWRRSRGCRAKFLGRLRRTFLYDVPRGKILKAHRDRRIVFESRNALEWGQAGYQRGLYKV